MAASRASCPRACVPVARVRWCRQMDDGASQAGESTLLDTASPGLDGPRIVAEQTSRLVTTQSRHDQRYPMQSIIICGLVGVGTRGLFLHSYLHGLSAGNSGLRMAKPPHDDTVPHNPAVHDYGCRPASIPCRAGEPWCLQSESTKSPVTSYPDATRTCAAIRESHRQGGLGTIRDRGRSRWDVESLLCKPLPDYGSEGLALAAAWTDSG